MSAGSTILHKRNSNAGAVPAPNSLSAGELAINTFEGKLFTKTVENKVVSFTNDDESPFILNTSLSGTTFRFGNNTISETFGSVLGGYNNDVSGAASTTVNGEDNDVAGDLAFIGSGFKNKITADGDYSAILAGRDNLISHENSFAIGSGLSSHASDFTYVNNISSNGIFYGDGSGLINVADTEVRSLTSAWHSTYETVSSLSASWSAADEVLVAQVKNAETSITLHRGDVVYTYGATGDVMSVKLASSAAETTSSKTLGIVNDTIAPNEIGYVTVAGRIDKMAFPDPYVEGDALWLGSIPGTFTRVKPVAPNHGVYLGVVERANNGNGIAYIKVQNGYELNEIHDVLVNNVSAWDVLLRNSTNTLWVNAPLSADKWNLTYTIVQSNSSNWNLGTELTGLSGNWEDVSTLVRNNSASWTTGVSGIGINDPLKFKFISDGVTNTYSVSGTNNSSNAAYIDVYVENVKQEPFDSYTLSSDVVTFTTTPEENTEIIIITPNLKFYSPTVNLNTPVNNNSDIIPLTANWQSTYTTVFSNSAMWNYDGSDIKALTADWVGGNEAYTTVLANSASWGFSGGILSGGNSFGNDITIGSNDAYKLTLETNNTPRMTILSGGNVGINTQTPNTELTIVGSISATDYIFHRTKLDFVTNTSHTFDSNNQSSLVLFNSVIPVSSYVPSDANSNFDIGYNFNLATLDSIVYVYGQAGVTIIAADDRNYLRTKGSTATLIKVGSNSWLLFGDIWKDGL